MAHPATWPTATAPTPCGRSYIRLLRDSDGTHRFTRFFAAVGGHINYLQECQHRLGKIDEETLHSKKEEKDQEGHTKRQLLNYKKDTRLEISRVSSERQIEDYPFVIYIL